MIVKNLKGKEWLIFLLVVFSGIAQVILDVTIPDFMANLTSILQMDTVVIGDVVREGSLMLGFSLLSLIIGILGAYGAAMISGLIAKRIRNQVFDKVMSFSLFEINSFGTASLITRCTNDVTQIQNVLVIVLVIAFKAPLSALLAFMKIAGKNIFWTITMGLIMLFIMVVSMIVLKRVMPLMTKQQYQTDDLTYFDQEHLRGIQVIQAFNAKLFHSKRFQQASDELNDTVKKSTYSFTFLSAFSNSMMNFFNVSVYIVGAFVIQNAAAGEKLGLFSDLVTFSSYALIVMAAFVSLVQAYLSIVKAMASGKRIAEVLNTQCSIVDGDSQQTEKADDFIVSFKDVSFAYPGSNGNMLEKVSFDVKKGETVAIIGATGSGKTTLLNLIPRMYDVNEGEILVKGRNVKDYRLEDLRNIIGYIPQKSVLFSGTISSNIDYGDNGRLASAVVDIQRAAGIGMADEFIRKKEGGYSHRVSEGGRNFSGGQKQRLSISRAVCRDPEIYLFDDSFSALDFKTDSALRKKLRQEAKDAAMIIVAQRIGTIKNADKIIVIDDGRIAAQGKHNDLMKSCTIYREIAATQLSEEEMKAYG